MSLSDEFRALRSLPGVSPLGLAWEAAEDAAESPLLCYVLRLHVLIKLKCLFADNKNPSLKRFIERLIAALQQLKSKLSAPFEANYGEAKESLRFNYRQCVADHCRDELSKELYIGFFKLMAMYDALSVFEAHTNDCDRSLLEGEKEDCKKRGFEIREKYESAKAFYDRKAETPHIPSVVEQSADLLPPLQKASLPTAESVPNQFAVPPVEDEIEHCNELFRSNVFDAEADVTERLSTDIMKLFDRRFVEVRVENAKELRDKFSKTNNKFSAFQRALPTLRIAKERSDCGDLPGAYKKLIECYNQIVEYSQLE